MLKSFVKHNNNNNESFFQKSDLLHCTCSQRVFKHFYNKPEWQSNVQASNQCRQHPRNRKNHLCFEFRHHALSSSYCCCCLLFNDGHLLQLWSEILASHTQMIYDGHMITGDECSPNFLTFNLSYGWGKTPEKTSTRKMIRLGIEPEPTAWEVTTCYP